MKKGIVLFLFLAMAVLGYLKLDDAAYRATLYLEEGLSQEQAEACLKKEDEQTEKVSVLFFRRNEATDLGVDVFEICGDARLLSQSMETLTKEDREGCLISAPLADKIFKSEKVKGKQLVVDKETYIIRGVYAGKEEQLIRLNRDEEKLFNQVRVHKREQQMAETTLRDFAARHGLNGNILQWTEYVGMVKGALLLAIAMILMIPWPLIHKKSPSKVFLVIYVGVVMLLLGSQIHIPIEMIPAKWSDFAYWSTWFQDICANIGNVFSLEKMGYERSFLASGIWSMVGSAGVILVAILLRRDVTSSTWHGHEDDGEFCTN